MWVDLLSIPVSRRTCRTDNTPPFAGAAPASPTDSAQKSGFRKPTWAAGRKDALSVTAELVRV